MYRAYLLAVLLCYDICFGTGNGWDANINPITPRRMEIRYDLFKPGSRYSDDGTCFLLKPTVGGKKAILYVDHYLSLPIKALRIRGRLFKSIKRSLLDIRLDNVSIENITFTKEYEIIPKTLLSGRVLTITTKKDVSICSVDSYTCIPGKRGEKCNLPCSKGLYGLDCIHRCRCNANRTCDPTNGLCPNGCNDLTNTPQICYKYTIASARADQYAPVHSAAIQIVHQGPTKTLRSANFLDPSDYCIDMTTQCHCDSLYISIRLTKPITLYGVELTIRKLNVPIPYSIEIKIDDRLCSGWTTAHKTSVSLGKRQLIKCVRENTRGKKVLFIVKTHNMTHKMNGRGVIVRVCNFLTLECRPGFYGRSCRRQCQCGGTGVSCDSVTGACPQKKCRAGAQGPLCTFSDLSTGLWAQRKYYDPFASLRKDDFGAMSYTSSDGSNFVSWLGMTLSHTYSISGVTLTLPDVDKDKTKQIFIFLEHEQTLDPVTHSAKQPWRGLPCTVPQDKPLIGPSSYHVTCPGVARTVYVVVLSKESASWVSLYGIQIWACADGLFGPQCEKRCNCKDIAETCDKLTGRCLSGCANGYKSLNCSIPCAIDDLDEQCPLPQQCHCYGHDQRDCGPVEALCVRGCQPGYVGIQCSVKCPSGFFGIDCQERCGHCRMDPTDNQDGTCLHTDGRCPLGCENATDVRPACRDVNATANSTWETPDFDKMRERRQNLSIEDSSFKWVVALIATITICTAVVVLACCVLKCYWDRAAAKRRLNEKYIDTIIKKALRSQMDSKIKTEHEVYHEEYLRREALKKLESEGSGWRDGKSNAKWKAEFVRKMIVEMETERRNKNMQHLALPPERESFDENQQDPNDKVARWILRQNFMDLIDRRKRRLKDYKGDVLHITESPYRISVGSDIKDIHALYDDVEPLEIA